MHVHVYTYVRDIWRDREREVHTCVVTCLVQSPLPAASDAFGAGNVDLRIRVFWMGGDVMALKKQKTKKEWK